MDIQGYSFGALDRIVAAGVAGVHRRSRRFAGVGAVVVSVASAAAAGRPRRCPRSCRNRPDSRRVACPGCLVGRGLRRLRRDTRCCRNRWTRHKSLKTREWISWHRWLNGWLGFLRSWVHFQSLTSDCCCSTLKWLYNSELVCSSASWKH